ncbi:HU family DNA-binding protein [Maridesulfovibrio frigidus]|uniref:HU family DNA-binding protein n=1 Tax=Maridesulfovibrio frigidus TaxID=340956 RepID=UPI0004E2636B|nr:HU family DNA-binding protein [Maridesulfovibrio frigidus]
MSKAVLVKKFREKLDMSAKDASAAIAGVLGAIEDGLKEEGNVTLTGFGTFKTVERSARTGRNPQTGDAIQIPASRGVKFTPGKFLKDAVK